MRAQGHKVTCLFYPAEVAGTDVSHWDVLGMEGSMAQSAWETLKAAGKPIIVRIIYGLVLAQAGLPEGRRA